MQNLKGNQEDKADIVLGNPNTCSTFTSSMLGTMNSDY